MKNKGLIITLIILLVIVIALLIGFLVLCLTGNISFKGGFRIGMKKGDQLIYNEVYDIQTVKMIDINQDAGDIIFENTEENNIRVEVYGEKKSDAEVSLISNELKIKFNNGNNGWHFFNFGGVSGDIKIYIPSTYAGNIKIKNDAGDIRLVNLENSNMDIDCDAGNIEIDKAKDAVVKCDAGNLEIGTILNKCNIKVNSGNVHIEKVKLKEDSKIKVDMGNVSIDEAEDIYVDAEVDLGKCNINRNNRNAEVALKIHCDLGDINVGK